jgi:hypothetical protein
VRSCPMILAQWRRTRRRHGHVSGRAWGFAAGVRPESARIKMRLEGIRGEDGGRVGRVSGCKTGGLRAGRELISIFGIWVGARRKIHWVWSQVVIATYVDGRGRDEVEACSAAWKSLRLQNRSQSQWNRRNFALYLYPKGIIAEVKDANMSGASAHLVAFRMVHQGYVRMSVGMPQAVKLFSMVSLLYRICVRALEPDSCSGK